MCPIESTLLIKSPRINAIAFYLPQFHPIAENDEWWGKGFTEWTNVSKAVPQFAGHYQPRLPGELGFYDLRLPEVMKRQIELAKNYGIHGFCFHYYWFTGRRRLLERPLNQFLDDPSLNFPFCVCWANENWSRRWDGSDQEILMEQRHEPQDDLEFIEDLSPFLKDPRYIRVDGRPLIIVYRVDIIPDARKAAEIWRNYCIKHGIGDPWLVAAQSFGIGDPREYGFDAAVEFPPHDIKADRITELSYYNPAFEGQVRSYESVVSHQIQFSWPEYNLYKSIIPAWDNEARRPGRGRILWGSVPFLYKKWLASICQATDARHIADDEKLVFINAWNEWAEGAYLEPDRRFGYAYLEATQQILSQFPQAVNAQLSPSQWLDRKPSVKNNDTAVILHLFYEDLWPEISRMLKNLGHAFDLYVSVPAAIDAAIVLRDFPNAALTRTRNRGRDIAPFLEVLRAVAPLGYSQICKIHSKKSLHTTDGGDWRTALLTSVLGSEPRVDAMLKIFRDNQDVGMVGAAEHFISTHSFMGENESNIESLRNALDLEGNTGEFGFFAGSMFWFRPEALTLLSDNLTLSDFDRERGQTDGTLTHALERLFTSVCRASGYEIVVIDEFGNQRTVAQHAEGELLSSTASYNFVPPTR